MIIVSISANQANAPAGCTFAEAREIILRFAEEHYLDQLTAASPDQLDLCANQILANHEEHHILNDVSIVLLPNLGYGSAVFDSVRNTGHLVADFEKTHVLFILNTAS